MKVNAIISLLWPAGICDVVCRAFNVRVQLDLWMRDIPAVFQARIKKGRNFLDAGDVGVAAEDGWTAIGRDEGSADFKLGPSGFETRPEGFKVTCANSQLRFISGLSLY